MNDSNHSHRNARPRSESLSTNISDHLQSVAKLAAQIPSPEDEFHGRRGRRYTEIGDHTWSFIPPATSSKRTQIVGYGNVPIPSYNNIAMIGPDRSVTIRCITWNVNDKTVKILDKLVEHFENISSLEDILCISIQEIPPSSKNFHEDALAILSVSISETHEVYISHRAWSQMMVIFMKKEHLKYSTTPTAKFVPSAPIPKPIRTKGGIGICFRTYQRWIVIVGCHLSHGSAANRIQDYHKLVRNLTFSALKDFTGTTNMLAADIVLWTGDLNFRVVDACSIDWTSNNHTVSEDIKSILEHDELNKIRKAEAFTDFKESSITFPPTHKYQLDREEYVLNRIPSYTDRVLYYTRDADWMKVLEYNCIPGPTQSDHRPVFLSIRLNVINKPIPQRYYSESDASSIYENINKTKGRATKLNTTR